MTLVFDAGREAQPSTHVLAIGVGRYPHLLGGDKGQLAAKPLGLKQLDSPPVSVRAIVEWFLAPIFDAQAVGFYNAAAPIGTIRVLASAAHPVAVTTPNGAVAVEPATKDRIESAFASWLSAVKSNDDNIGVFYFCGHGMMVSDHYLLADDFGSGLQPWAKAFDISSTIRAVEREVKGALYFFLDACREVSRDLSLSVGASPSALMPADLTLRVSRSSLTCISATGEGQLAFAAPGGQVSRFTRALIKALSGFSGVKAAGQLAWEVDGETLASAVRKILEYEWEKSSGKKATTLQISEQLIHGKSVPLLRLNAAPKVSVEVNFLPEDKRALYELYLQSAAMRVAQTMIDQVFETEVPMGVYTVGAFDPAGELDSDIRANEELRPPRYNVWLGAPL